LAKTNYIDRPPRIQPELPFGDHDIPNPPEIEDNANRPILQAALPLVMILGYILVSMNGSGRNMLMIIPMAVSVVASTALAFYSFQLDKKMRAEKEAAYKQLLVEIRRQMMEYKEMQSTFYHGNYPDTGTTLRIAQDLTRPPGEHQEDSRSGSRLWERRSTDKDFSVFRLGLGTLPSTVIYKLPTIENYGHPMIRDAVRLSEESRYVQNVPVTIPLRQNEDVKPEEKDAVKAVRHAIGITGVMTEGIYQFLWASLVDYSAYQSPADARIYIIGSHNSRQQWRWAFSLPHCKETDGSASLVFESDQEERPDKEPDQVRLFLRSLRTILERRKVRIQDKEGSRDVAIPHLMVIIDVLDTVPSWSALNDLEAEACISLILQEGQRLGASIFFLVPSRAKVPSPCEAILEVDVEPETKKHVFRYAEVDLNTPRYVGEASIIENQDLARDFARALEPLSIRRGFGSDLGTSVSIMEMLRLNSINEIEAFSKESWARWIKPQNADWLGVEIGLMAGNEVRRLTFSAKGDGVHGLVAGSTGSGKSELLTSLIIGLAVNYDPSIINFVLVDYKGGSAFEPFRHLPHVVDIVTNLEGSATGRMFASIKAELDRRQRLNTYTDSKDIVHYRKKGLHLEEGRQPYPHLFIIIDEFAEMIAGNTEFKSQLESITRLGRSLGVTLILAAQRPIGVTDQMRANIKFRICLRVETPEDSRELLRRSDAAFLPPGIPGRGYLQVGNENIELIQTSYTGSDYRGEAQNVKPNVIWLNRPKKVDPGKSGEPPKLFEVINNMCINLSKEMDRPVQWRPWPAFLPRKISLEDSVDLDYMIDTDIAILRSNLDVGNVPATAEEAITNTPILTTAQTDGASEVDAQKSPEAKEYPLNGLITKWVNQDYSWKGINWEKEAIRPVIGLIDNPFEARQLPLVINFPVGHAVIFGASGWGKTTFLRTLILSLAVKHSPDELQIYIMDFGGRNLSMFKDMPHVGAIVTSEEEERVTRLLRKIGSIIEKRQILFSEAGANDLYTYNVKNPDKVQPAVLVAIDNFAEFKENFENSMPTLISLVRESRAYGVHFIFTGDQPNALSGKLFSLVTERMTLKLSDASEYAEVVGRGVSDMGNIAGRGFVRIGQTPLEFQTALPVGITEDDNLKRIDENEKLKQLSQKLNRIWANRFKGEPPATIETLPFIVSLDRVMQTKVFPKTNRILPFMGINDQDLDPYLLDLQRQGPHFVIIGPPNSGKTTSLRTILISLASQYTPKDIMIVLVDFGKKFFDYGGKRNLAELPHVVNAITKPEDVDELAENLRVEAMDLATNPGRRKVYVLIDNYDSFSEEGQKVIRTAVETIANLAREYGTSGLHFIASGSPNIISGQDDLRKQIVSSSFGLGLQTADTANRLNGRVPRSLAEAELPLGRGFIVKSGRTIMIQIATPYSSDENIEGSLDNWVDQICERTQGERPKWLRVPPPKAEPLLNKEELESVKKQLKEMMVPDDMLATLGEKDLLNLAKEMGIKLPEKKETEKG
jgi:S-DNA-T family DNA segregation ATPase FtsK/SpoIIIE